MKRSVMDRIIDTIEAIAADVRGAGGGRHLHLGAAAPLLQRADPRCLRFRQHAARHPDLLGHRRHLLSRHATSRSTWSGRRSARAGSGRSTCSPRSVLLFVVTVQTYTLFDKVTSTYSDNVLTYDLGLPTWPFFAVAWVGDVSAVLLIAIRTYRLIFHPEDIARAKRRRERASVSADTVAILGFVALFALMLLRVPVGMAMGLVGVTGYAYLTGGAPALKLVGQTSMRTVTELPVRRHPDVPADGRLRLGLGREPRAVPRRQHLRRPSPRRAGARHHRLAAAGSPRSRAPRSRPRRPSRPSPIPRCAATATRKSFSTGVIAAGGTLGAMLPPSTVLAVYGLITQQDIGKLFQAGILPGPAGHGDVHDRPSPSSAA